MAESWQRKVGHNLYYVVLSEKLELRGTTAVSHYCFDTSKTRTRRLYASREYTFVRSMAITSRMTDHSTRQNGIEAEQDAILHHRG